MEVSKNKPYTGGSKMSHYTHFTTEERELSRVMRAQGFSDCSATIEVGQKNKKG